MPIPEPAIPPETHFAPGLIERAHEGAGADALVDEIVGTRAPGQTSASRPSACARCSTARRRHGPARLLRALRRARGQAALGGQDSDLRQEHAPDRREPPRHAVHLIRDGRDVVLSRRARGDGRGQTDRRHGRPLAAADRGGQDAGPAPSRPVPRAALRGPGHPAGAAAAARLRADRARLRRRDARLSQAGRWAAGGARRPAGRGRTPRACERRAPCVARRSPRARRRVPEQAPGASR